MNKLNLISQKKIQNVPNKNGDIRKILNKDDISFVGFGEIYTSFVKKDEIKAWKFHKKMTLNLTVIFGEIKFVFFDGFETFKIINTSHDKPFLITVPPKIWYGFKSLNNSGALIMNLTDFIFDEKEILRKDLNDIKFKW